jgi:hypothetical protein
MAQQVQINLSDGLEAKVLEEWGSVIAWKDWIKTATRKEWQDKKITNLHLAAAQQIALDATAINNTPD